MRIFAQRLGTAAKLMMSGTLPQPQFFAAGLLSLVSFTGNLVLFCFDIEGQISERGVDNPLKGR